MAGEGPCAVSVVLVLNTYSPEMAADETPISSRNASRLTVAPAHWTPSTMACVFAASVEPMFVHEPHAPLPGVTLVPVVPETP